jgi:CheY-like chemotaxis protein
MHSGPAALQLLVVDDAAANRRLLAALLGSEGYRVRVASTGQEALDLVLEDPPDGIVLDLLLPDMHGSELVERLRGLGFATPILVVTGDSRARSIAAAQRANAYLLKPYDVDALLQAVAQMLGRSPA